MAHKVYEFASAFSRYPGGRYVTDGPHSGEEFRNLVLRPALEAEDTLELRLDGTRGFASSFLEEAFGGLVRLGYPKKMIATRISLVTSDEALKEEVGQYISEAIPGGTEGAPDARR